MIVGEPSLMGGDMDDEDERYITRLENTQYDPNTQYHSPQGYQQNPNLQSLLHQKQQYLPNSQLLHPNQMKREQVSFHGSPQQQQQLPSMFSNNPSTPSANTLPSTPINGEISTGGRRISSTNTNSPQTPSSMNHNQVR
jgi:hypothetical protein